MSRFLKLFGVGLALAVVMDATVIRGLLVPAFMRLAGPANWWARRPSDGSTALRHQRRARTHHRRRRAGAVDGVDDARA